MKTAVEWLIQEFDLISDSPIIKNVVNQAKIIEKQQIIDAWVNGGSTLSAKNAEQYYNETYKK